jgi:hypothetical protein
MVTWDMHRDLMGTPSIFGAMFLVTTLPSPSWWHFAACFLAIVLFAPIHRAIFGLETAPRHRRNVTLILLVLGCQLAFWAMLLWFVTKA